MFWFSIKHDNVTGVSVIPYIRNIVYLLYTQKVFLQHARYGIIESIIINFSFNDHVCIISDMNLDIKRTIIIGNENAIRNDK